MPVNLKKINFQSVLLVITISFHLIFSLWLLYGKANGFYCYNMDEMGRSEASYEWLRSYLFAPHLLWTPLQFWIAGAFNKLFPSVPILIILSYLSIFLSCGFLLITFLTAKKIAPQNNSIGVVILIYLIAFPLFNYLSISGLAEMILSFWGILGTYFWLRYNTENKTVFIYLAAISFNLASATRIAGFFFVVVFDLYCLMMMIKSSLKPTRKNFHQFFAAVISAAFIATWLIFNYLETGNIFSFIHMEADWFHDIESRFVANYWMKAIAYPYYIIELSALISTITFLSVIFYKRFNRPMQYYYAFIYAQFGFLIITSLIVGSKPTSELVVFPYLLMFIPGVMALCGYILQIKKFWFRNAAIASFGIAMVILIYNNFIETIDRFHNSFHADSIAVGNVIRDLYYKENILSKADNVVIELLSGRTPKEQAQLWDPDGIRFFMPNHIFLDRKQLYKCISGGGTARQELVLTNNPSLFDDELRFVGDALDNKKVKVAILFSEERVGKISEIMEKAGDVGGYKIFVRNLTADKSARIKSMVNMTNDIVMLSQNWIPTVYNGATVELIGRSGDIICKTSSLREGSIAVATFQPIISGAFEVNVDFELGSFPFPSREREWVQADIAFEVDGERYSIGRRRDSNGKDAYWMWGGGEPNTYISTKDTVGRLRARRIGSTLYGDFWDGAKWVNIGSRVMKSGTASVSLDVLNKQTNKYLNVRFNNFKAVSGESIHAGS